MRVIMLQTVKLSGTDIVLNEGQVYEAVEATNQPDYKKRQVYFVESDTHPGDSVLCTLGDEMAVYPGGELIAGNWRHGKSST